MNSIFSVDDFSDLSWQATVTAHPPVMSRSASEWELEKFLEEFPAPTSSSASDNTAVPSAVSQSPTLSKPRNGEDDVVEIEKPEIHPLPPPASLPRNFLPQPLDRASLAPTDSEDYRAFLKSQLDLACAAAAKSRESSVKPEGVSSLAEDQTVAAKNLPPGSQFCGNGNGNGNGISKAQSDADGGSLRLPALTSTQRKQEIPARQTTSGSSREDSDDDDLDGDTGTNEHMDPADEKRARRMQSNRESARRSRRRKQAQLNELEAQVGHLRDERTSLLTRLTDINKKCDDASVDNRILNANIETLRTKVQMAEDQVKRVTGLNPLLLARSNMPSIGMQFVAGQTDASAGVAVPMQPNNNHFFHHSVPNIPSSAQNLQGLNNSCHNNNLTSLATNPQGDNGTSNIGGMPSMQQLTATGQAMADTAPMQHVQKQTVPRVGPATLPSGNKVLSHPVAKDNKKK
ncbi:hypothetical protein P3X46_003065 [Hevea brasiliensis]|uniref:BZIP domain-containing protein n=1 Tax=Hevea brasiliensis TaxID=3981 RepID=A0ABQ9N518_HEVBR|nr:light-inducible protein CPRF2-like isoform X2 [Hevea brasiliensis]KAJ9187636.1 hypothetical protein P3X46_003065 [Hevea brasiliensis]